MDEAALLNAIVANPDDDTPRLVYADWLDDHGQSPRAEFIRTQIELARLTDDDPRRPALQAREAELLRANERSWAPDNHLALFFKWRRGFVAVLDPCARGVFGGDDGLKILAEFPTAEELQIGFCMWDEEFCHMPVLPNLRSFGVGGNVGITDTSIRRIGKWKTLRRLRLNGSQFTDTTLTHLAGLTNLRELDLSYTRVADDGLALLASLSQLEVLDLTRTGVTGRGLASLSKLPRFRCLNLTDTMCWQAGIRGLAGGRALEELRVGTEWCGRAVVEADLQVLPSLPALRVLDLGHWCELSDAFVASLRERLPLRELWFNRQQHV
ncbi:TIGR02996 domain-containing protein [bacterium]|nr:TIGR02996 domain-containing protein [bacterium]